MKKILYLLAAALITAACANDDHTNGIVREGLLTIPNVPGQWTYVSLTSGKVVGTCALSDTAAQRQWAARTDWDLATCNGRLRTNGGNSGCGQGAAAVTTKDFEDVDPAPSFDYRTDGDSLEIW